MSRSARLTADEIRGAMRAVADCRDVGNDPAAWSLRISCFFLEHLRSVLTTSFTLTISDGQPTVQQVLFAFWADNRLHARWLKFLKDHGYRKYPSVQRFAEHYAGEPLTVTRRDLIDDRHWRASAERHDRRAVHQDEMMLSAEPYAIGLMHVFSINRADGDGPFSAWDRSLVRLIHDELGRHFGKRLSIKLESQAPSPDLTPRLHAVLTCLCSGDSDKEIAVRLGLSVHTIHEYVTFLYRRFDVHSRAEIIALAHRKHWLPSATPPK